MMMNKKHKQNKKFKVALCLYGKFNNRYSNSSGLDGFDYISKQIFSNSDCEFDVFIYSTDLDAENEIRSLYGDRSKASVFKVGPNFDAELSTLGIFQADYRPLESFRTVGNTLSFMYSRKQSIQLMNTFAIENSISYDSVICCRFDLGQIDKVNGVHPYKVSEINFNPNYDMNFIYSAMWNQMNIGLADQWFYSNPETLTLLEQMFESVIYDLQPESEFLNSFINGIPDSNKLDEFSNEILKSLPQDRENSLVIDPKDSVNNHLLHKSFFYKTGLINKSRYVSDIFEFAKITYTHSDYKDVWPIYFGQAEALYQGFQHQYVFVDRYCDEIPNYVTQVLYDDTDSYVDRLLSCLPFVTQEHVFFEHEDMILFDTPNNLHMLEFSSAVMSNKVDFVKLIRGGKHWTIPSQKSKNLSLIHNSSKWIFSIQPSFWNKKRFISLLSQHKGQGIWEFEENAQLSVKKLGIRGGVPRKRGVKRGRSHWDSRSYPFVATAIVKGKWNVSEYKYELVPLLEKYGIDPSIRGVI